MGKHSYRTEIMTYDSETGRAVLLRRNLVAKAHWVSVKCKFCSKSESVVCFGYTKKGTQRYLCYDCNRTFVDNKAPIGMRFPTEVIATALNMFYESASLHKIQRQIQLTYGVSPDHSTIYRWIVKYSRKAIKELDSVPIKVGSTWVADETVLRVKEKEGSKIWHWDILDAKTRFLLASHLSEARGTKDAQILMERAAKRANKVPETVITDKLAAYLDGVELTFGADTKHIPAKRLASVPGTQIIERFHGTLKDRTKVMRGFLRKGTAKIVTDGWRIHYDFFRPHSALGDKTPAEVAGAEAPFKNWADVVKGR